MLLFPDGTDFEDLKGSWIAGKAWHCERPEDTIGEGGALSGS